jgi:hypothetical protein
MKIKGGADIDSQQMKAVNNFSKYYKTITNSELLSILDNPGGYQPAAVEAAKNEFLARQLSDAEIKEAKEILRSRHAQKEKQKERVKNIENKIKATGSNLIETLNPIQSGIPSTEKKIRFIVVVFGGLFLYQLLKNLDLHIAIVKDIPGYPFTSMLHVLPLIMLPVALLLFWKRMSIGWTLFTVWVTFTTVVILWSLIQSFLWRPSGIAAFDNVFAAPSTLTFIIQLLFYSGTLYLVCKQDMRNVFQIAENKMIATVLITGAVSFFAVYAIT